MRVYSSFPLPKPIPMIRGDKKDSDILRQYCTTLAGSIQAAGEPFTNGSLVQRTYLDLLRRIWCNMSGIILHLYHWPDQVELKLPISLAFRTTLTDALTGLYLATFHTHEEAFQHELMALDLEYYKYVKTIFENTALEMPDADPAAVEQEMQVRLAELARKAEHLLQVPGGSQLKKPEMLRDAHHKELFHAPSGHTKPLTEKEMFNHLKAHPETAHLAHMYLLQRHLSQQHHYAPGNRNFIELPPAYECRNWFLALVYVTEISGMLMALLGVNQPIRQVLGESQAALLDFLADRAE